MIIIIDAYNILKHFYADKYITPKERARLVQLLIKYGKKRGHELYIVFDGGPYGLPERKVKKPATIIYTGAQERADDYIIREMKKFKEYDLLIVSTDREITNQAEKQNIPYIDATLFYTFVRKALIGVSDIDKKNKQTYKKMHQQEESEDATLDELMQSVDVPANLEKDKDTYEDKQNFVKGKKLSKNEQRLMNVVDKL